MGFARTVHSEAGRRLREARLRAGLTQAQLADASGLSVAAISKYERGSRRIPTTRYAALARALDIERSEIETPDCVAPSEVRALSIVFLLLAAAGRAGFTAGEVHAGEVFLRRLVRYSLRSTDRPDVDGIPVILRGIRDLLERENKGLRVGTKRSS